jgi:hypothetical protein
MRPTKRQQYLITSPRIEAINQRLADSRFAKEKLKDRKKDGRKLSKEQQAAEIYSWLFPDDPLPVTGFCKFISCINFEFRHSELTLSNFRS